MSSLHQRLNCCKWLSFLVSSQLTTTRQSIYNRHSQPSYFFRKLVEICSYQWCTDHLTARLHNVCETVRRGTWWRRRTGSTCRRCQWRRRCSPALCGLPSASGPHSPGRRQNTNANFCVYCEIKNNVTNYYLNSPYCGGRNFCLMSLTWLMMKKMTVIAAQARVTSMRNLNLKIRP